MTRPLLVTMIAAAAACALACGGGGEKTPGVKHAAEDAAHPAAHPAAADKPHADPRAEAVHREIDRRIEAAMAELEARIADRTKKVAALDSKIGEKESNLKRWRASGIMVGNAPAEIEKLKAERESLRRDIAADEAVIASGNPPIRLDDLPGSNDKPADATTTNIPAPQARPAYYTSEAWRSDAAKKAWATRRARYGPSGRR